MVQLYGGLYRNDKWYRYTEIENIKGGVLAVLDGADKSGASRVYNLVKSSISKLFTADDEEYILTDTDYKDILVQDTWKISRESFKKINKTDKLIFPEFFYCPVCSDVGREKYTEVNDDWDELVESGFIDEFFLEEDQGTTYWTELPVGIEIPSGKTLVGGTYNRIKRKHLTIGDVLKIQKNNWASESDTNMICSSWDASILEIEGMPEREFNIYVTRNKNKSFCKTFLIEQEDIDAMSNADEENLLGYDATERQITCSTCYNTIRGGLDFTNFFQSLLSSKKSSLSKTGTQMM